MRRIKNFSASIIPILLKALLLSIPILLLINFGFSFIVDLQLKIVQERTQSIQREIINNAEFQMKSIFKTVYNDLNLIKNSDEFTRFLETNSADTYSEAQEMFLRILISKPDYFQLRYLSLEGKEILRVDRINEDIVIKSNAELQDKSDRYYTKSLQELGEHILYISDFDLNIEHEEYVYPYEPTVRFGVAISFKNQKKGFLIINFDGLKLLELLSNYEENRTHHINLGIIDKNHLISLNVLDSYETLINSFLTIINEENKRYYDVYQNSISNDHGFFSQNNKTFYYKKLFNNDDPPLKFDPISDNWILLTNYDMDSFFTESDSFLLSHQTTIRFSILILSAFIIFILTSMINLRKHDSLLLAASGYISDYTHDGVIITDAHKRILYCNKEFENMFGFPLNSIKGKKPQSFLNGQSSIIFGDDNLDGIVWEGNLWNVTLDNTYILKYLRIKVVFGVRGKVAYYIGIYSEPKLNIMESDNNYVVNHHFIGSAMEFLNPIFEENFSSIEKKAVIVIRLNEFNFIRSQITDKEESHVLSTISNTFKEITSSGGLVIVPASGIVLIVSPIQSNTSLHSLLEYVDASIGSLRFSMQTNLSLNYISGIAVSPEHGIHGYELINNAFIALEALTKMKKTRYLIYDQDIYDLVRKDKIIRDEIENAFNNHEFSVAYQLQQDSTSLQYTGVEALVRWNSPKIGPVSPVAFIPIMEDSNQIVKLGKYVLSIILMDFKNIIHEFPEDFKISINLSSQEFNNSEIIAELLSIIADSGIPNDYFCFEITETTIVENTAHTNTIIQHLHEKNIIVAIDDFGTGYSSLSYLKNLDSDKIKIDRMFIKDFPSSDDGRILKSIIHMVKTIPKKIIVEGVETSEQLDFIRELNCEEFQGYLSSKPIRIDEIYKKVHIKENLRDN